MSDVMHNFEMYQPDNVDEAINLLSDFKKDAWVIAGGKDSLDWFKDRVKTPKVVVDISGIADMVGFSVTDIMPQEGNGLCREITLSCPPAGMIEFYPPFRQPMLIHQT